MKKGLFGTAGATRSASSASLYDKKGAMLYMTEEQAWREDAELKKHTVVERLKSPVPHVKVEVENYVPTYKEYDPTTSEDDLCTCKSTNIKWSAMMW